MPSSVCRKPCPENAAVMKTYSHRNPTALNRLPRLKMTYSYFNFPISLSFSSRNGFNSAADIVEHCNIETFAELAKLIYDVKLAEDATGGDSEEVYHEILEVQTKTGEIKLNVIRRGLELISYRRFRLRLLS